MEDPVCSYWLQADEQPPVGVVLESPWGDLWLHTEAGWDCPRLWVTGWPWEHVVVASPFTVRSWPASGPLAGDVIDITRLELEADLTEGQGADKLIL